MSRYIDADALKEAMQTYGFHSADQTITEFIEDILPIADVVEVVRCKDCTRQMICFHSDDYFCADGERRKE